MSSPSSQTAALVKMQQLPHGPCLRAVSRRPAEAAGQCGAPHMDCTLRHALPGGICYEAMQGSTRGRRGCKVAEVGEMPNDVRQQHIWKVQQ